MRRFIFTLALLGVIVPQFALARDLGAEAEVEELNDQCRDGSQKCTCNPSLTISTDKITETDCEEFCEETGGDSYRVTCETFGGATSPIYQGSVVIDAPVEDDAAAGEAKPSPIIPNLNVDIPGLDTDAFSSVTTNDDGEIETNFLGTYIVAVYSWLIGAATIVAVVMMMIGGIQYAMARGKSQYIEKAKHRITNAITGLVLLLAAYNIAFLMNPAHVSFTSLAVQNIPAIPYESMVEYGGGVEAAENGVYGVEKWQDCMLTSFGASKSEVEQNLVYATYQGRQYQVHKIIKDDLQAAFDELTASGSTYTISSIGTYNWRANANNKNVLSFHAWGVALDINPDQNPNTGIAGCTYVTQGSTSNGSGCTYDLPPEVVAAFKNHNFGWGGNWSSLKDYMHFSTNRYCGGSH